MIDRDARELLIGWTAILLFALAIVYFRQSTKLRRVAPQNKKPSATNRGHAGLSLGRKRSKMGR
jgi:hypothetical protein